MAAPTPALSAGPRRAAIVGLVLSAMVSVGAGTEATSRLRPPDAFEDSHAMGSFGEALARSAEAQARAADAMPGRALLLWLLAFVAALTFIACGRLIRPAGVSRESMRRLASVGFLTAAILRTLDGAQLMVIARRGAYALNAALTQSPELSKFAWPPEGLELMTSVVAVGTIAVTALFAGSFVVLSQYFRSDRVKAQTTSLDRLDSLE